MVKVGKVSHRKFHKGLLNLVKPGCLMAKLVTAGQWEWKHQSSLALFHTSTKRLWLAAVIFGADGPCFDLAKLWCYVTGLFISQGESSQGWFSAGLSCSFALPPSLPHLPGLQSSTGTRQSVFTCVKHLKLLRLNVPFSGYDFQKAIASEVSKPRGF